ncbi:MAG: MiaB/RimO family radical SAM methylthiotransferase [Candidatus Gracilibacteria bacterium]|nr:MiaB/RimO family radical SAM methylthiotransferase [Candidatus Gracilibacteria bacterium]
MRKYFIQTFGCEMNKADSEKINMILLQSGLQKTSDYKNADLIILNTCSVRKKGEDRVFGLLREIEELNKDRKNKIITGITGCMVRKTGLNKKYLKEDLERNKAKNIEYLENKYGIFNNDDKLFPRMLNLDFTLRIEEIKYLNMILTHIYSEKIGNDDKFDDYLKQTQLRENKFQASVVVQTGCDNYCSFCIVPYTRGKEISREHNEIIAEITNLAQNGTKEISLVGQNVNSYGKQKNLGLWNQEKSAWNEGIGISPFRKLLNNINKIEGIDRIRFTSSNPHDMTFDILDAHFELEKTCNYLHFALQSGNDEMLKKMNRKHTYNDFKKMVEYLRKKDSYFSISTDIIVGFSGETDEMFKDTLKAIKELEIDFIYIARYSVRSGTLASKIYPDDIPDNIKAKRWHILNTQLEENVKKRGEKMIGKVGEILISGEKDGQFFGRTRNFKEVFFDKIDGIKIGDIVKVRILEVDTWVLLGEII